MHAGADRLRELDNLGLSAAFRDAVAADDHRRAGIKEKLGDPLDGGRVRPCAGIDPRRWRDHNVGLLVHHIRGHGYEHRASRRLHRQLEGAAKEDRHFVRVLRLDGPLGERLGETHDIAGEDWFLRTALLGMLSGVHHERRVGAVRVVKHAQRVAEAGRDVQLKEGGARAGSRVAVRDAGRDAFVERQDVFELRVVLQRVHERLLGCAGIAEDVADALGEQLLEHGVAGG